MVAYNLKTEDEKVLLDLIKNGDYDAFDELYERHFDTLYGVAYNLLREQSDAKDIIQEVFIWFWEHREQWNLDSCKWYLLTAVKFKVASYFREHKSREDFYKRLALRPTEKFDQELEFEVRQLRELIEQVAAGLSGRVREVFMLSRFEYLSNKEIAGRLDISEKTVEAHITNALKLLREKLGKTRFLLFFLT